MQDMQLVSLQLRAARLGDAGQEAGIHCLPRQASSSFDERQFVTVRRASRQMNCPSVSYQETSRQNCRYASSLRPWRYRLDGPKPKQARLVVKLLHLILIETRPPRYAHTKNTKSRELYGGTLVISGPDPRHFFVFVNWTRPLAGTFARGAYDDFVADGFGGFFECSGVAAAANPA